MMNANKSYENIINVIQRYNLFMSDDLIEETVIFNLAIEYNNEKLIKYFLDNMVNKTLKLKEFINCFNIVDIEDYPNIKFYNTNIDLSLLNNCNDLKLINIIITQINIETIEKYVYECRNK